MFFKNNKYPSFNPKKSASIFSDEGDSELVEWRYKWSQCLYIFIERGGYRGSAQNTQWREFYKDCQADHDGEKSKDIYNSVDSSLGSNGAVSYDKPTNGEFRWQALSKEHENEILNFLLQLSFFCDNIFKDIVQS